MQFALISKYNIPIFILLNFFEYQNYSLKYILDSKLRKKALFINNIYLKHFLDNSTIRINIK